MKALHSPSARVCPLRTIGGSEGRQKKPCHGRQGKRPAFGAAYVVGWIGQFADIADMPCWRFHPFSQGNQRPKRHRTADHPGFPR